MMTNPNWKNPGLNIDENLLSETMKKLYRSNRSISPAAAATAGGLGVAGTGAAIGAGIAGGQAATGLAGEVVKGITPGGTAGNLSDAYIDAPGSY